jgi:hypothetical protein
MSGVLTTMKAVVEMKGAHGTNAGARNVVYTHGVALADLKLGFLVNLANAR